ncbi:MAG TPA: hypothetical protein VGN97_11200 [Mesorhizobium sp.]|jgi:hypothetical protein|nr:hypothetical protein [Mesorhizobium sp.]
MRKLVWFLAFVAAALWSLMIWAGYAFLGWANEAVAGAPGAWGLPPDMALWVSWAGYLFEQLGQGAAIVIWILGLGLILLLAFVASLFFGARRNPPAERFPAPGRVERRVFRPDPQQAPPAVEPRPAPLRAPTINWGRSTDRR